MAFTEGAARELGILCDAALEAVSLTHIAFSERNDDAAVCVEPLEQVIDKIKAYLRSAHIERLRLGNCSIEAGFVWSDLISNMERVSDHCSNIAACVLDLKRNNMNLHESLRIMRGESPIYKVKYDEYSERFLSAFIPETV